LRRDRNGGYGRISGFINVIRRDELGEVAMNLNTTIEFAGRTYPVEVQFEHSINDPYPSISLVRLLRLSARKGDVVYLSSGHSYIAPHAEWDSLEIPLPWIDVKQQRYLLKELHEQQKDEDAPRLGWGETRRVWLEETECG